MSEDEGKPKTCGVAIAYRLAGEENKKKDGSPWKIIPLNQGQVSIFFPAEKETSNLRFHIHGPFASTVARDSVRDCKANIDLRNHLAELVVESLIAIRNQGMLTVEFLAVLPNPADNLAVFYDWIRRPVVEAFQKEALTPTRSGAHAPATALYRGPARIAEVLTNDDLSVLTGYGPPFWAANPPPQAQREERFLESIEIDTWGWDELASIFNSLNKEKQLHAEKWLSQKDDGWLMRFYALLGEACSRYSKAFKVDSLCIVRVEIEDGNKGGGLIRFKR